MDAEDDSGTEESAAELDVPAASEVAAAAPGPAGAAAVANSASATAATTRELPFSDKKDTLPSPPRARPSLVPPVRPPGASEAAAAEAAASASASSTMRNHSSVMVQWNPTESFAACAPLYR